MEPIHLHRTSTQPLTISAGFTLVELLVVIAIIGVIMTIVLTSQSTFNKTLILKNTAYDIALTLRGAQTYGMNSRSYTSNVWYGIHFVKNSKTFQLFADTSGGSSCVGGKPNCVVGDRIFNEPATQTYTLGNGITINDLCANGTCGASSLDIVFARPNPDVYVGGSRGSACITVTSGQGGFRHIFIGSSGQIIANAAQCP
jgi:prepilin-type N-terminal cleavage/methylation domain-containing protein